MFNDLNNCRRVDGFERNSFEERSKNIKGAARTDDDWRQFGELIYLIKERKPYDEGTVIP
jgi:hypothetical protein